MFARNSKKNKKVDILEMSDAEKAKLVREIRKALQDKMVERKLWHSLLDVENLEVNGNIVYNGNAQLNGLHWNKV